MVLWRFMPVSCILMFPSGRFHTPGTVYSNFAIPIVPVVHHQPRIPGNMTEYNHTADLSMDSDIGFAAHVYFCAILEYNVANLSMKTLV